MKIHKVRQDCQNLKLLNIFPFSNVHYRKLPSFHLIKMENQEAAIAMAKHYGKECASPQGRTEQKNYFPWELITTNGGQSSTYNLTQEDHFVNTQPNIGLTKLKINMKLFNNKIKSAKGEDVSSRKKILLVTRPIAPPWDEGSKNFAFFLAKNIADFEIGLLTKGILPDLPSNVHQKAIYTTNSFSYLQKIRLLQGLRKMRNEFDILHYLFTPTKQNSFLVKNFINYGQKKFRTIQTVATLREDLYSDKELQKMLFGDLIITYSDWSKNKLEKIGFKNVKRVYPGIDVELYRNKGKNPEYLQKYGFKDSDFIINFSGEYTRNGAIDIVLTSFMEIAKIIPEAKLSLAVRIKNKKDAEKKKEVIKILEENNLLSRVAFHDETQYAVFELYNMADISVFPVTDMHGKFDVPLAVIETMACEKPVIISDLPLLSEFAKEDNSVRIEKGSPSQLNSAILDLYYNPEKCAQIGKAARRFAEDNFDIRKIAEIYQKIYKIL